MIQKYLIVVLTFMLFCCRGGSMDKTPAPLPQIPEGAEIVTLGGGCFWCIEAVFDQLDGVYSATSGYMGGEIDNPTYDQVVAGASGHAEVVQVVFDPKKLTLKKVLEWFWKSHDPTQLNRQGNDIGTQYRSVVFYHKNEQKAVAESAKLEVQSLLGEVVHTQIEKAPTFFPAEVYHQSYYFNSSIPTKNKGYCEVVIKPKLRKLKLKH